MNTPDPNRQATYAKTLRDELDRRPGAPLLTLVDLTALARAVIDLADTEPARLTPYESVALSVALSNARRSELGESTRTCVMALARLAGRQS